MSLIVEAKSNTLQPEIPSAHLKDIIKDLESLNKRFLASGKQPQLLNYEAVFPLQTNKSEKNSGSLTQINRSSPYAVRQEKYRKSFLQYLNIQDEKSLQGWTFQLHSDTILITCFQSQEVPGIYISRSLHFKKLEIRERLFMAKNSRSAEAFITNNPKIFN